MGAKTKILVCGDVDGKFKTLFSRVASINEKSGPFDFLVCVGNFFGSTDASFAPYRNGTLSVPVPVYILGPTNAAAAHLYPSDGSDLCPNVSQLGRRGQFTSSGGLHIAYVSGATEGAGPCDFNVDDVTATRDICVRGRPAFRGVDLLLTGAWPTEVAPPQDEPPGASRLVAWLAAQLKPRYHFAAGTLFERAPYINHSSSGDVAEHATRFCSLAAVGNAAKAKWLTALSVEPVATMRANELYQRTTDMTVCPFGADLLLSAPPGAGRAKEPAGQFFYDMEAPAEGNKGRKRRHNADGPPRERPVFDQATCWFCLASAAVERHLVVSVGDGAYLALAKGALVDGHVLILPVEHHQALAEAPDAVVKEVNKLKAALRKHFRAEGKVVVFFERNYKTSHFQVQAIPVPTGLATDIKEAFLQESSSQRLALEETDSSARLSQLAPSGSPYFCVDLPDGSRLFARCRAGFPLQFGRDVLASPAVLDMEDRADWRDCKLSVDEETAAALAFREAFAPNDPTL